MPDSNEPDERGGVFQPPILSYQRNAFSPLVTVGKFYNALDAQLVANELDAAGIWCTLTNQNTNTLGPYSAFSQVELQVRQEDVEDARGLMSKFDSSSTDLEPEHDVDPATPVPDPAGKGVLVTVAAFDKATGMFDAAAALGAAHVESFLPVLVPRREGSAGKGNRFVVRVRACDLERAHDILEESDEDEAEPRCPSCGSWRVYAVPVKKGLLGVLLGLERGESGELECLRCRHRWRSWRSDK